MLSLCIVLAHPVQGNINTGMIIQRHIETPDQSRLEKKILSSIFDLVKSLDSGWANYIFMDKCKSEG